MKRNILIIYTLILGFAFAFPMILTITNSFMTVEEIQINGQSMCLIPQRVSLRQYYTLLIERTEYLEMLWKSIFLTSCIVIGNSIYSIFIGSILAKVKIMYKNIIILLFIAGILLPYQVNMVPYYIEFKALGMLESNRALIFTMIVEPFGVIMMTFLVRAVPDELIEAVRLETNSLYYIFFEVIVPFCKGGITILTIFIFSEAWNMVEQPRLVYSNLYKQPLSVLLNTLESESDIIYAACVIYMVPVIISYFWFQEALSEEFLDIKL